MIFYLATLYTPEGEERFLAADGTLTACHTCAMRFLDAVSAEEAATRALAPGWAFAIEQEEI